MIKFSKLFNLENWQIYKILSVYKIMKILKFLIRKIIKYYERLNNKRDKNWWINLKIKKSNNLYFVILIFAIWKF